MSRVFKQFSKIVKEMQESSFQVKVPIFNMNIKIPSKIKDPQHDDWGWSWSKLIQSIVNESNSLSLTLDQTW